MRDEIQNEMRKKGSKRRKTDKEKTKMKKEKRE